MNKQIIALLAVLFILCGSVPILRVIADDEPETATQTERPIRSVPVKEETYGSYNSKRAMASNAGTDPAGNNGDSAGGALPASEASSAGTGYESDATGGPDLSAEYIEGIEGTEQTPEIPYHNPEIPYHNIPEYIEEAEIDQKPIEEEGPALDYLGTWTITAYCGCAACCGEAGNATASGRPPISGHTVACNDLPFFTQVMIDGVIYEVEDTGYTEYGDCWIDIYFDTHEEALAYGVQAHDVYLIY